MSQKRSRCRGLLSPFWWWFLTLLGLPLLFLLMTYFRQGVIENDLTERVTQSLKGNGIDWAEVDVNQRGRDVMLSGMAASEAEREQAVQLAQSVEGVNRVDHDIQLMDKADDSQSAAVEPSKMPVLNAALQAGQLSLQGKMGSQEQIDGLVKAANERFGAENVTNQLTVEAGLAEPDWLNTADELMSVLPDKEASLNISDNGFEIAGTVNSDEDKETMLMRAKRLFGDNVMDDIAVKKLKPATFAAVMQGDKLSLSGTLGSQEQADALVRAAADKVGAENVDNQLEVSDQYADAEWLDGISGVLGKLTEGGLNASVEDGTLVLTGEVTDEEARNQMIAAANQQIQGSGLTLVDQLQVKTSGDQEAATTQNDTGEEADAGATEQQAAEQATAACQEKLDEAMQDKTILFQVNKDAIRSESFALLDQLVTIVDECKDNIADKVMTIGGHTDSDGSDEYNLGLSQRRADAVRNYLVEKGIAAEMLKARGFGEAQPVASNVTAEGRSKNRRISFEIGQQQ